MDPLLIPVHTAMVELQQAVVNLQRRIEEYLNNVRQREERNERNH
jgi:hypothetical protein